MGQIVRRVSQTPVTADQRENLLPERIHRGSGMFVKSQVELGIEPKLYLSWAVIPSNWAKGYTLLVFHSMSGFSTERYPDDLNRHGQLVIETAQDETRVIHPAEGTHYYSFILHKKCLLGFAEKMAVLRFSESVPSAAVAIGRIRSKLEFEEMIRRHELGGIEHEAKLNEAEFRRLRSEERLVDARKPSSKARPTGTDAVVAEELAGIDAILAAVFARRKKTEDVKNDPRFQKLSRREQKEILDRIKTRLDAGEVSARRDLRG
jgi:hypothetical protein